MLGRLDPAAGKITQYPFPHSENTLRELFLDSEGRMWYGTPSNNTVGYFYLTTSPPAAGRGVGNYLFRFELAAVRPIVSVFLSNKL